MKRKYLYIAAFAAVLIVVFYTIVKANSTGAVVLVCGAPNDDVPGSCGSFSQGGNCHDIAPITNSNALKITMLDASTKQAVNSYQLGKKYIVKIELTYRTLIACGFESTIENSSNAHVGTMAAYTKCQVVNDPYNYSVIYATHINSSRVSTHYGMWQYYWTAPTTGNADVIVYAAGNSANGNGNQTGDTIFNTTKAFPFHTSGIDNNIPVLSNISIYPSPAKDNFTISCSLTKQENTTIDLYNLKGQQVKSIQFGIMSQGENKINADIKGLPAGLYFVRINEGGESTVQKILVGE